MRAASRLAARLLATAGRGVRCGEEGGAASLPPAPGRRPRPPPHPSTTAATASKPAKPGAGRGAAPPGRSAFDGLPPPGADAEGAAAAAAAADAAPGLPRPIALLLKAVAGAGVVAGVGAAALTVLKTEDEVDALAAASPEPLAAALAWYAARRRAATAAVAAYADPPTDRLLPDLPPHASHVRTLVLDLDDLLVHSHWTRGRGWRTFKRPGVDDFLRGAAQFYEVVVYTHQLPTYADPILDR